MGDTRADLIDAAVVLAAQQRFQDVLAGVDTRSITDRAGVTTGSFFHHFRNRGHFAQALADRCVALWEASTRELLADVEALAGGAAGLDVRQVADADWRKINETFEVTDLQQLLWVTRTQPLGDGTDRTAGDVLAEAYASTSAAAVPVYRAVLESFGREMMPPFDLDDLAVTITALVEGLQIRSCAQPDAVREGLFTDLVSIALLGLTRPVGERADQTELALLERQLMPTTAVPTPSGGDGDVGDDDVVPAWRQIADAAAPLFVDRLVSEVRVAEIAAVAGVSTSTVYHHFGTVSAVAASGWARHFPELERLSVAPYTAQEGPLVRLEQVLTRYVELGQANRGALEGLVLEVLAESGPAGPRNRPRQIRTTIPLASLLVPHVQELRVRGKLRRRIDSQGLARSMLQLVSMRTLMAVGEPVERIIDETLGVLLDGALAQTSD